MKLKTLVSKIENDITNFTYGKSGHKFITINTIAEKYDVAYVTALKSIPLLKQDHFIMNIGNINFITLGKAVKKSDLIKKINTNSVKYIGIHTRNLANPFFSSIIQKISKILIEKNYIPIICSSNNNIENEILIMKNFIAQQCIGVISFSGKENEHLQNFYSHYPLPITLIGKKIQNIDSSYVLTDNYNSGICAANYLIEQGYKQFLYINNQYSNSMHDNSRLAGFKQGLTKNNIEFTDENILLYDHEDFSTNNYIVNKIKDLLKDSNIGIFCYNDLVASSILNLVQNIKAIIPDQVGIIGYDNLEISQYLSITTFEYSFDKIAASAINFLIDTIENDKENQTCTIQTTLFVRNSTKK